MNSNCFKTVFSKRHGALVAVGEHASSQGKANGAHGANGAASLGVHPFDFANAVSLFLGALTASFALVTLAWAQPALNALPTGGQVAQGAVQFSQSAQQLNINQASDRAAVNWQSFDIGAAAKVNVVQPSAQSVLLNRVGGTAPSQIFGQLSANGRVILVNPNGMVFGRDGSVSASAFTGSTLNISDADFMAGNERYTSDGAAGAIVNRGLIQAAPGGYVALLGASVSNEGRIVAPQGDVYLAAADAVAVPANAVALPLGQSGRIKLELTPASINAAVANQKGGTIVTEGGQVYLQAAAVNAALATIIQSGSIDTTGEQGGAVHVLADGGRIRVDGSIKANSTGTDDKGQAKAGGDIYIGRDKDTNVLAAVGDVSGAMLESKGGFVETSGADLKADGISVKAKDWLLDPDNIDITGDAVEATAGYSKIKASDIETALNAGTSVTVATTAANQVNQPDYKDTAGTGAGSAVAGDGNILVNAAIVKSGANDASLTLNADNGITVNQRIGKASGDTSSTGKLDVTMTASGDAATVTNRSGLTLNNVIDAGDGHVILTGHNSNTNGGSRGVNFNNGSGITANTITVTGTATGSAEWNQGVLFSGTSSFKATGTGSSVISGISSSTANAINSAVVFNDGSNVTLDGGDGSLTVQGTHTATGYGGIRFATYGGSSTTPSLTTRGNVTLGTQDASNASLNAGFFVRGGLITADTGSLTIKGQATGTAVTFHDNLGTIKSNSGSIALNGVATTSGRGVLLLGNSVGTLDSGADVSITGTSAGGNAGVQFDRGNVRVYGKNVTIDGTANTASGQTGYGFYSLLGPFNGNTITAAGNLSITGTVNGAGSGTAIAHDATSWQTLVNAYTAGGTLNITGTNTSAANTSRTITMAGVQARAGGDLTVSATTNNAATDAIYIWSRAFFLGSPAPGYVGGASSFVSTAGNTTLKSNQGSIYIEDGVPNTVTSTAISGKNVIIDNTGGTFTGGVFTAGTGVSTSSGRAGVQIADSLRDNDPNLASNPTPTLRTITATDGGQIVLSGKKAVTAGSGVEIRSAAALTAANITIIGENTGATGAAINISNRAASLNSTQATTLTAGGLGSGTSLVAAGNIHVGTQLKVTTPAAGTISGLISGNGSLLKMGAGQTKLTAFDGTTYGTNTFAGGTTISQGSILLGNGNGSYNKTAGVGDITLGDANTGNSDVGLWIEKGINSASQVSLARNITVSNNGTGTATIGAAGTGMGGWSIITGTIDLNRNVTFADMTNDRLGLDGQITGTGNITIAGSGSGGGPRVSMATAKTFTGDVTINAGVQLQASAANLFNSSTNVLANGTFNLNGTNQAINSFNGANTGRVINGMPLATLTVGSSDGGGAFAGVISGGTKLIKNGTGTQVLSGNNTYTGGTNVAAGTLQIGNGTNNGSIGAGAVDIATGTTLNFNVNSSGVNYGTSNTFTGGGTFKKTGAGGLTWGNGIANFSLGAGALIDVQQGILTGAANANDVWVTNKASLNVAGGAIFAGVEGDIKVDALTGAGVVTSGYPGYAYGLTVGVNGGSGTFAGSIQDANGVFAKLTKTGAGTQILMGNNTYSGTTTISEGVLQVGNGGTTGNLGTGAVINNASLVFNRSNSLTVANAISGSGTLTHAGSGTSILTGNNSYAGITNVSNGTLQVGNGGTTGTLGTAAVTLTGNANLNYVRAAATSISNAISGTGNVNATITGSGNALTVDNTINLTDGKINLVTDGALTVNKAIGTSSNATDAILLVAGKSTAAGTSGGGDVSVVTTDGMSGSLTTGATGRTTIMTGSIAGSTGLGVATGNNRYNSDEAATNYTSVLGATGKYAIYREAPTLTVKVNNASKTYDGLTYSGGNGFTESSTSGLKNSDALTSATAGAVYGGTAQNAKNASSTPYTLSASESTSGKSALGYVVNYESGELTVGKANLELIGSRAYDGTTITAGAILTAKGVGSESFAVTGSGDASNLGIKNASAAEQTLTSVIGLSLGAASFSADVNNYNALTVDGSAVTINRANLTAISGSKTYDGQTATLVAGANGALSITGVNNETATLVSGQSVTLNNANAGSRSVSSLGAATFTSSNSLDLSNYVVTDTAVQALASAALSVNNVIINKANLTAISGSKTYDGQNASMTAGTSGGNLSIVGVNAELATLDNGKSVTLNNANAGVRSVISLGTATFTSSNSLDLGNYEVTDTAVQALASVTPSVNNVTINTANLVLTGSRSYDGTTSTAGAILTAQGVGSESFAVTGNGDVTNLFTKNASTTAQTLASVRGLSLGAANGSADANNYTSLSTTNSAVTITPKVINASVTAADKVYDGNTTATLVATSADILAGDTVNVTGLTGSFASKNVARDGAGNMVAQAVTVTGSAAGLGGADGANYVLGNAANVPATSARITPRELTLSGLTASDKVYDGNTAAQLSSANAVLTGLVAGDSVNVSAQNGQGNFVDKNVARGANGQPVAKQVLVSGLALTGADQGNYQLGSSADVAATITPRTVTLTGSRALDKVVDSTTTAQVVPGTLEGLVAGEQLGVNASGEFEDALVGTNKLVNARFALVNGSNGLAGNYDLANTTAALRAAIVAFVPGTVDPSTGLPTGTSASRIRFSGSSGAGAATGVSDEPAGAELTEQCSVLNPQLCECEDTKIPGVEMCFAPTQVVSLKD